MNLNLVLFVEQGNRRDTSPVEQNCCTSLNFEKGVHEQKLKANYHNKTISRQQHIGFQTMRLENQALSCEWTCLPTIYIDTYSA